MPPEEETTLRPRRSGKNLELGELQHLYRQWGRGMVTRAGVAVGRGISNLVTELGNRYQQAQADCQYGPVAAVIGFIHREMTVNEAGTDVAYIRDNLDPWQWDNLIPLKYDIDIIQAYVRWYDLVKGGGPWDHKVRILSRFGEWTCDFPYRLHYRFDIWSNIHYGFVGLAAGFPKWDLLAGAGAAQKLAGTNPPGYWKRRLERLGDADFLAAFDDPKDQQAIKVGFELWQDHGTKVTTGHVLRAVRKHSTRLATKSY